MRDFITVQQTSFRKVFKYIFENNHLIITVMKEVIFCFSSPDVLFLKIF